jgi:long-chain fatty acid transport protein
MGDGDKAGWNASALYRQDAWSVGLSYRSGVDIDVNGSTDISGLGTVYAKSTLSLPYRLQLGVGYRVKPSLYAEFDIERIGWGNYQVTTLEATGGVIPAGTVYSVNSNYWRDIVSYRLGLIYRLSDSSRLLFGTGVEETGQDDAYFDATVADADRYMISFGLVHDFEHCCQIKFGYQYTWLEDRIIQGSSYTDRIVSSSGSDTDPNGSDVYNGRYEGAIRMLSMGVSMTF